MAVLAHGVTSRRAQAIEPLAEVRRPPCLQVREQVPDAAFVEECPVPVAPGSRSEPSSDLAEQIPIHEAGSAGEVPAVTLADRAHATVSIDAFEIAHPRVRVSGDGVPPAMMTF